MPAPVPAPMPVIVIVGASSVALTRARPYELPAVALPVTVSALLAVTLVHPLVAHAVP